MASDQAFQYQERAGKSMSRKITFEEDTSDYAFILDTLETISEDLHQDLTAFNFAFEAITAKIKHKHFEAHTCSKTLPFFTDN